MALSDDLARSVDEFTRRVRAVGPEHWSASTPCSDWDVRALVNHVVSEQLWAVPLFEGATIEEVGNAFDGDLLGTDPVSAAASAGAAAKECATDAAIARHVHLSFGDTPGDEYARQLLADHLVHSWDLAVATGGDTRLDRELVAEVTSWFGDRESMYRQGGAIGPRVAIPPDADPQDHLLAAFGRDPNWRRSQ